MIAERTKALLSAASTIYATGSATEGEAVGCAYALLDAIEAREKQNAPKTRECTTSAASGRGCVHNVSMDLPCYACWHEADE